jgi:hypothetical protein
MSIILDGTSGITTPGETNTGNNTVSGNETITGTLTASNFNAASTFGFKNRIINGAMVIDQRYVGTATANTINGYVLDRWYVGQIGGSTGKIIAQQNAGSVTPPSGYTNYLGITSQSAYTVGASQQYSIQQPIEGFNTADLAWGTASAKTVTLSFWVRSSLTGTFAICLRNTAPNRSYVSTYTISSANTWEQKTITIAGDTSGTWNTSNSVGIYLDIDLGSGSSLSTTANTWTAGNYTTTTGVTNLVGTNGATFYITGVQLEVGSKATTFDTRSYGQELALCQRYYFKVAPGSGGYLTETAFAISTTGAYGANKFPVTMRTAPASLEQSGTAGDYRIVRCGAAGSTTCSSVPTFATATVDRAFTSFAVSSGLSSSSAGAMDAAGANAFLAWNAEL